MSDIRCDNLHKTFGHGLSTTHAVRGVTAQFETGKIYSIIGKSGSGKSTLLHMLCGILQPDKGEVFFNKISLSSLSITERERIRRQMVGIVFQDYQLLPELTVRENILLPQVLDHREPDEEWCNTILERLDIGDISAKLPHELSGGQQQRVAIGRAISNRPPFVFADEPTGNLDKRTSAIVLDFLLNIKILYDPMIMIVTHDLDIARSADEMLRLEDGQIAPFLEGNNR